MSSFFNTGKIEDIIHFWSTKGGFQRANRYRAEIYTPNAGTLEAVAISVQTPARNIEYIEDTTNGPSNPSVKVPIRNFYDDRFIVTFIVDAKWQVRKYMEEWMDSFFPSRLGPRSYIGSTVSPYNTNNLGRITFTPLNTKHEISAEFAIDQVYPKSIFPGEMGQQLMDTPMTLIVDFNYRYYQFYP